VRLPIGPRSSLYIEPQWLKEFRPGWAASGANDTEDSTLAIAIELEGHCYSRLRQSDDFKEGVEAFNAKRPPKFVGR
jgi:hypothetical protein